MTYQKAEYENLAKLADAKIYHSEFYQLTF